MPAADGSPGIQKVSHKHEEIMNFMLANPTHKLGDIARHFGMTQAWLSCVIHSEAFQARLAEKQEAIFSGTVLPLKEKLEGVAHQLLDKLEERIPTMADKELVNLTDNTLNRLGFGTKPQGTTPGAPAEFSLTLTLRTELEQARSLIGARPSTQPGVVIDGQHAPIGIGAPSQVRAARPALERMPGAQFSVAGSPSEGAEVPAGTGV